MLLTGEGEEDSLGFQSGWMTPVSEYESLFLFSWRMVSLYARHLLNTNSSPLCPVASLPGSPLFPHFPSYYFQESGEQEIKVWRGDG
jgi:hypothetical protein